MLGKMCVLCGHEELFPGEFAAAKDRCPVCKRTGFIQEAEIDDDENEGLEAWQQ